MNLLVNSNLGSHPWITKLKINNMSNEPLKMKSWPKEKGALIKIVAVLIINTIVVETWMNFKLLLLDFGRHSIKKSMLCSFVHSACNIPHQIRKKIIDAL